MADETETEVTTTEETLPPKTKSEMWSSRRKMAWVSLWGIIVPTIFIIFYVTDVSLMDKVADLMSWYYIALASIVGAYMGFKSWATIKGRGKSE
jgi:hypothetical protein